MIVLDTHIWVWWVHDDEQLPKEYKEYIEQKYPLHNCWITLPAGGHHSFDQQSVVRVKGWCRG